MNNCMHVSIGRAGAFRSQAYIFVWFWRRLVVFGEQITNVPQTGNKQDVMFLLMDVICFSTNCQKIKTVVHRKDKSATKLLCSETEMTAEEICEEFQQNRRQ